LRIAPATELAPRREVELVNCVRTTDSMPPTITIAATATALPSHTISREAGNPFQRDDPLKPAPHILVANLDATRILLAPEDYIRAVRARVAPIAKGK